MSKQNVDFGKYNIRSVKDLMSFLKQNMRYGFTYRGKIFTEDEQDLGKCMDKYYKLRLGEDFIQNKYGVCWDFCELERQFFISKNIEHECYYIQAFKNRDEGGPTHTFALFKDKNGWSWFEYSWQKYCGIHKYNSKEEALKDITLKFANFYNVKLDYIELYKTSKVFKRLNSFEFVEHCIKGEHLDKDAVLNF